MGYSARESLSSRALERLLWKTAKRAISYLQDFIIYVLKFHKKRSHPDVVLLIFYTLNSLFFQVSSRLSWSFIPFCRGFLKCPLTLGCQHDDIFSGSYTRFSPLPFSSTFSFCTPFSLYHSPSLFSP